VSHSLVNDIRSGRSSTTKNAGTLTITDDGQDDVDLGTVTFGGKATKKAKKEITFVSETDTDNPYAALTAAEFFGDPIHMFGAIMEAFIPTNGQLQGVLRDQLDQMSGVDLIVASFTFAPGDEAHRLVAWQAARAKAGSTMIEEVTA